MARRKVNVRLPEDLLREIDDFCEKTGLSRSDVTIWALEQLFAKYGLFPEYLLAEVDK